MNICKRCDKIINYSEFAPFYDKLKNLPDPYCSLCSRDLYRYIKYLNSSKEDQQEILQDEKESLMIDKLFGNGKRILFREKHTKNNIKYWKMINNRQNKIKGF